MPDNSEERKIRVIDSSVDLEIDDRPVVPGGDSGTKIDTSDATAEATDLIAGKTAYARGVKLIGTYHPLDTSDATAVANDIKAGKSAYVDGNKINGILEVGLTQEEYDIAMDLCLDILGGEESGYSTYEQRVETILSIMNLPNTDKSGTGLRVTIKRVENPKLVPIPEPDETNSFFSLQTFEHGDYPGSTRDSFSMHGVDTTIRLQEPTYIDGYNSSTSELIRESIFKEVHDKYQEYMPDMEIFYWDERIMPYSGWGFIGDPSYEGYEGPGWYCGWGKIHKMLDTEVDLWLSLINNYRWYNVKDNSSTQKQKEYRARFLASILDIKIDT